MWYMIDYEDVHEEELYGIEILKKDNRILVFYNMGDKESVENGKLRKAAEKGTSFQNIVLYKRGKSALDLYISSRIGEIYGQGIHQGIVVISEDKGSQVPCEYRMYIVDIKKKIILRNTIYHALFDSKFDQLGYRDPYLDFKAIYPHCIRQYGRKMGCEFYWYLRKYMETRRDYVSVINMQDQREYYVALRGYKPGIHGTVNDCERNIIGYSNALGRAFSSHARAEEFFFDYLADNYLAAFVASMNELWNDFCYHVNQSLQYENKTIMNGSLAGYVCGGVHVDTRRLCAFWIIALKDGIVIKMKDIIHENEKMKKIGAVGGELPAGKAVLAYVLKHEYQGIKMYYSHIKVIDWTERDMHADKLPYRLHVVIEKAKEKLRITVLHFQQENRNL